MCQTMIASQMRKVERMLSATRTRLLAAQTTLAMTQTMHPEAIAGNLVGMAPAMMTMAPQVLEDPPAT